MAYLSPAYLARGAQAEYFHGVLRRMTLLVALASSLLTQSAAATPPTPPPGASAASKGPVTLGRPDGASSRPGRASAAPSSPRRGAVAKRAPLPAPPKPGSVGHPNEGRLEGGVRLDTSRPYLRVVPSHERRDARWGLPALVGMIDRAARAVAKRYPDASLNVGDLSLRSGGELLRHNSHESGRDADLGFYVVDAAGKSVHARTFVQFDETLKSSAAGGARFDLARNWLLVQHMVTDPVAQVSHIFVAEPLRKRLLAHARSIGVSQRILDRAAIAMMQPSNALPHDDHFHVRISCPRSMRGTCIELAKETRRGSRVAHRRRGGAGRGVLKTPGPARASTAPAAPRAKGAAPPAPRAMAPRAKLKETTLRGTKERSEPAAAPAATDPLEQASRLSLVPDHDEADADAAEVKDAIDDSGAPKITD